MKIRVQPSLETPKKVIKMIYFTSDLHFGHKNIINYCNRPFSSVEEMNEKLIENWNSVVKPNDIVYNLGDFSFHSDPRQFTERLNGEHHLILGNHDRIGQLNRCNFASIKHYNEIKIDGIKIVLFHYPMISWNGSFHGSWQLYGHCHGTNKIILDNSMDVGVDCNNYLPISFDEIKEKFNV